jgi:hypothetical protein
MTAAMATSNAMATPEANQPASVYLEVPEEDSGSADTDDLILLLPAGRAGEHRIHRTRRVRKATSHTEQRWEIVIHWVARPEGCSRT